MNSMLIFLRPVLVLREPVAPGARGGTLGFGGGCGCCCCCCGGGGGCGSSIAHRQAHAAVNPAETHSLTHSHSLTVPAGRRWCVNAACGCWLLRWRRRLWIVHRAQAGSRSRESGGDSLTLTHTHSLSRQGGDGACECCVWLLDASRVRWRAALLALWLGDFSVREWFSRFSVGATGATVVRALFDFFRSPPPPHRFVPRMNCTDRNRSIS